MIQLQDIKVSIGQRVLGAIRVGWAETRTRGGMILDFLAKLVTGRASLGELGGPILIGQISSQAARPRHAR